MQLYNVFDLRYDEPHGTCFTMVAQLPKGMLVSRTLHMSDLLIWEDFRDGQKGNASSKIKAKNLHPLSTSILTRLESGGTKARRLWRGVSRSPSWLKHRLFSFWLNANIVFTSTWINTLVFWCLVSIWSACLYKLYFVFFRYTTIFEPLPGIILLFSENDWLIYGSLWWNIKLACRPYLHKCPQQRKHSSLLIFLTFGQKPICSQYVTGFGGAWTLKYPKPSEALYPGKYKILWHFPLWVLNTKTV